MGSKSSSSHSQGAVSVLLLHAFMARALMEMCLLLDSAKLATKLGHSQASLGLLLQSS